MNCPRSISLSLGLVATAWLTHPCAGAGPASDVPAAQKRAATVELARQLILPATAESMAVPTGLRNPFDPASKPEVPLVRPTSDRELLEALADQVHPTGVFFVGDSPILLLGQKKVKLNEKQTLSFDGQSYEVEFVAIERTTFTLRYNNTDVTRSIKPGKNP